MTDETVPAWSFLCEAMVVERGLPQTSLDRFGAAAMACES